eukprot:6274379-Prymnesium_polylepis.2
MKERAVTPLVVVDKPRPDEVMALPARDDRERLSSTNPRVQRFIHVPRGPARRAQRGGRVRLRLPLAVRRAPSRPLNLPRVAARGALADGQDRERHAGRCGAFLPVAPLHLSGRRPDRRLALAELPPDRLPHAPQRAARLPPVHDPPAAGPAGR